MYIFLSIYLFVHIFLRINYMFVVFFYGDGIFFLASYRLLINLAIVRHWRPRSSLIRLWLGNDWVVDELVGVLFLCLDS